MLGITLHRPWDWALSLGLKPVENRDWACPPRVVGKHVAVHAGKVWSHSGRGQINAILDHYLRTRGSIRASVCPEEQAWPGGAVVGLMRIRACVRLEHVGQYLQPHQAIWASGGWCWLVDRTLLLPERVPCSGRQGLWDLPPDVEARVRSLIPQGFHVEE